MEECGLLQTTIKHLYQSDKSPVMKNFKFIENIETYKPEGSFVVTINSEINSKEELLKAISINLRLPDYFGINWDALDDCLRDFHWIEENSVVIVHKVIPHIKEEELKIYLNLLNEAVKDWVNSQSSLTAVSRREAS